MHFRGKKAYFHKATTAVFLGVTCIFPNQMYTPEAHLYKSINSR